MSDLGGEPACWAHLVDELDTTAGGDVPVVVDVGRLPDGGTGTIWSLPHGGDLDANLVRLDDGTEIEEHVNDEVDVLVVVWHGTGTLTVGERSTDLRPGVVALVPRGARRSFRAAPGGVDYLSVHRRRGPMTIGGTPDA